MLTVDARRNGGVSIKGWDQNEVLVRARVQAAAGTQSEADQLAKQIKIETAGAKSLQSDRKTAKTTSGT
jgi:hypothetical protein